MYARLSTRNYSCLQMKRTDNNSEFCIHKNILGNKKRQLSTLESLYSKLISLPSVHYIEDTLANMHDNMGLPWWATIMLSTGVMRLILTLPAHITQQKVMAKRYLMTEELNNQLLPALEKATNRHVVLNKWSKKKATDNYRIMARKIRDVKGGDYNCHMSKMFLPMYIQIPVWVLSSVAVRNIAIMRHTTDRQIEVPVEERFIQMSAEGGAWFSNLTIPDPTFILPTLVGLSFSTTIYISANKFKHPAMPQQISKFSRLDLLLYSISILMIPLASIQPSAVVLYWVTSGVMGVSINLLLLSPMFRRAVRIPKIPAELDNPYSALKDNLIISINKRSK